MISELRKILEEAPEGATHYADLTYFRKRANFPVGTWFEFTGESQGFELSQASNLPEVARLSDIKLIVELYEFTTSLQLDVANEVKRDELLGRLK